MLKQNFRQVFLALYRHIWLRRFLKTVAVLGAIVLVGVGGLIWRLHNAPLSLSYFKPIIDQKLLEVSKQSSCTIAYKDITLVYKDGFRLQVDDLNIHSCDEKNLFSFKAESLLLRPSVRGIWKGEFLPRRLEVNQGFLDLSLLASSQKEDKKSSSLFDYLRTLRIKGTTIKLSKQNNIFVKNVSFSLSFGKIKGDVDVTMSQGAKAASILSAIDYHPRGDLKLKGTIKDLNGAHLINMLEDLPLIDEVVRNDLKELPEPDTLMNVDMDIDIKKKKIQHMNISVFAPKGQLVGKYLDHPLSLEKIDIQTVTNQNNVSFKQGLIQVGDAVFSFAGNFDLKQNIFALGVLMKNLNVGQIATYWPQNLAPNPRAWVTKNLSKGVIEKGTLNLVLGVDGWEKREVKRLDGLLDFKGIDVNYLDGMPVVKSVSGQANYDLKAFKIKAKGGKLFSLTVGGDIDLLGLDLADQDGDLRLNIEGDAHDALKVIEHKPLELLKRFSVKPEDVSAGKISTNLSLKMPLKSALKMDEINVLARSKLSDVSFKGVINNPLKPLEFSKGFFDLSVTTSQLKLSGQAHFFEQPCSINWVENFSSKPFISDYHIKGIVGADFFDALKVDVKDYVPHYGDADISYQQVSKKKSKGKVTATLTGENFKIPQLNWIQSPNVQSSLSLRFERVDGVTHINDLLITSPHVHIAGVMEFDALGHLRRILLSPFNVDKNILTVRGEQKNNILTLDIGGVYADLSQALVYYLNHEKEDDTLLPLSLTFNLPSMIAANNQPLKNVSAEFMQDQKHILRLVLRAQTPKGKPLDVYYNRALNDALKVRAEDAGALIRSIDILDSLENGVLTIDGHFDASKTLLEGTINLDQFQVKDAPLLAKLLSLVSVLGIFDLLSYKHLNFETLKGRFSYHDDVIKIKHLKAQSVSLGLTARGFIDQKTKKIDLMGTVIPLNIFNSIISNIPLVGDILSGFSDDGILAASYTMKGPVKNPEMVVNPLSFLTPGLLRKMFEGDAPESKDSGEASKSTAAAEKSKPTAIQTQK